MSSIQGVILKTSHKANQLAFIISIDVKNIVLIKQNLKNRDE